MLGMDVVVHPIAHLSPVRSAKFRGTVLDMTGVTPPPKDSSRLSPHAAPPSRLHARARNSLLSSRLAIRGGRMDIAQRAGEIRRGFERAFWVANISEIFERLAYYGSFASLANYLRETLNFPTEQ